jgi:asparagine synthase (glutamine-hydrolysing)
VDAVKRMVAAMAHRGPDDCGVQLYQDQQAVLGHCRLSIIDVSQLAHQPMSYAQGRYWISFNGEIYNYRELRQELEQKGHSFHSGSDTEVLLAAYTEWGEACIKKLRGMFAFALLDRNAHKPNETRVLLARDRLGIKPLYFARKGAAIVFASELKALMASRLVGRSLDRRALWNFLSLGSVPQPSTILRNVMMLPPGHLMRVSVSLEYETERYWSLRSESRRAYPDFRQITAHEASDELRRLLNEAVRYHMIADVPIAAFLSGGIDSSTITGLMAIAAGQRVSTFTVGFDSAEADRDERHWARMAAAHFSTDHHEVVITPDDVARAFDGLVHAIDQPSLDGTNTYLVSRAAARSFKAALSGIGGDELFAGYPHFRKFAHLDTKDRWLKWVSPPMRKRLLQLLPMRFVPDREMFLKDRNARYLTLRLLCKDDVKERQVAPGFLANDERTGLERVYEDWLTPELDVVSETTHVELSGYLANTLLRDSDAVAMANSLEVRPVFLDHPLVEFAFAIPPRLKIGGRINKPVLVNAVRDLLPTELIERPKLGFEMPLLRWMMSSLQDRSLAAFSSSIARKIFSAPFLLQTTRQIKDGTCTSVQLWAIFILIEWLVAYEVDV